MDKSMFFKLPKRDGIAIIIFFIVSIAAFFPAFTNAMWAGLTVHSWILCVLTLLVPIYNIAVAYLYDEDRDEGQ